MSLGLGEDFRVIEVTETADRETDGRLDCLALRDQAPNIAE